MLLGLLYSLVRSLLDAIILGKKSDAALRVEVLALRQQLRVLERQVRGPRFQPADRPILAMEVGSRCIHLAGYTVSPTGAWVVSRHVSWPGCSRAGRSGPASCSETGTRSSRPASMRSSAAKAWRSSACLTGRPWRTHTPRGGSGRLGARCSIIS